MTPAEIAEMTVPDKIWIVTDPRRNSTTGWWWSFDPEGDAVEYTRSDIQKTTIIAQVAEIERLQVDRHLANLNAEALAEIKATVDGESNQTVKVILYGLLDEIARAALEGTPK